MNSLKAILFDMDGVIVDTELEDFKTQVAFVEAVNQEHARSSEGIDFSVLVGKSYGALQRQLHEFTGGVLGLDEMWERFLAFDKERHERVDLASLYRPETEDVLALAKRCGLKTAVVSSSSTERIEEVLSVCGIRDDFDFLVSGECLEKSKPYPTIYRNALKLLSVEPGECVAIEDSTYGIEAALAAGIPVIAYEETRVPIDQSAATWKVRNLSEAAAIIRSLVGSQNAQAAN